MADNDKPRYLWGYIYPNLDSDVYAQSSANLASTGEMRNRRDSSLPGLITGARHLDEYVGLSLKGDPRLEKIKEYARELKDRYVNPVSKDYIANVREREKTITDLLMVKVHEAYGVYSEQTKRYGGNVPEWLSRGIFLPDDTPSLGRLKKDSLVCRHYAPIISLLLHDAGIPNDLVSSSGCESAIRDDKGQLIRKPGEPERHVYVFTRGGNAVVEATVAGQKTSDGKNMSAYDPIVNGVTVEDIVYRGEAALTEDNTLYGGHAGKGKWNKEETKAAQDKSLQRYNDALEMIQNYNQALRANPPTHVTLNNTLIPIAMKLHHTIDHKGILGRTKLGTFEYSLGYRFCEQISALQAAHKAGKNAVQIINDNKALAALAGIPGETESMEAQFVRITNPAMLERMLMDYKRQDGLTTPLAMTKDLGIPSPMIQDALAHMPPHLLRVIDKPEGKFIELTPPDPRASWYSDAMRQDHPYIESLRKVMVLNGIIPQADMNAKSWTIPYDALKPFMDKAVQDKLESARTVVKPDGAVVPPPKFDYWKTSEEKTMEFDTRKGNGPDSNWHHSVTILKLGACTQPEFRGCYEMDVQFITMQQGKRMVAKKTIIWANEEKDGKKILALKACHDTGTAPSLPESLSPQRIRTQLPYNAEYDQLEAFFRELVEKDTSIVNSAPKITHTPGNTVPGVQAHGLPAHLPTTQLHR